MKNNRSFFVKCWFIALLAAYFGSVSGQVVDSTFFQNDTVFHQDTIPKAQIDTVSVSDSLLLYTNGDRALLDSIPELPDSLRRMVIMRLADPLDTLSNRIFAYQVLGRNSYARSPFAIDTTLNWYNINNPVMRNYHISGFLGNLGQPYYPISFEARKRPSDFMFIDNLTAYFHDPEETVYYQTQAPFSHISFSSAGPKLLNETVFNAVHTQNVNKNLNLGLYYDIFASEGQYVHQNTSNNAISLFSAYRGAQYSMYANINWNNARMRKNGGLADLADFEQNDYETSRYAVRSSTGRTDLLNRSFYVTHSYSPRRIILGRNRTDNDSIEASRLALAHTLRYEWNVREYKDTEIYALHGKPPPDSWNEGFANSTTRDSLHFRRMTNHLRLLFREQLFSRYNAGFSVGLLTEADRYNINTIPKKTEYDIAPQTPHSSRWGGELPIISGKESTVHFRETYTHFNTAVTGSFFNHTGRYLNWNINGKTYFAGYKMGDVNIDGSVQIHYYTDRGRNSLLLGGSIDNVNPGYFFNKFTSNLLIWENEFNLSQEIRLRGEFTMPHRSLKLGAYLSQLNNYIYFNREAMPEQSSELLVTGTAYVEKDIRWWNLGFRFRLYGQYSSNDAIIPLPAFAGFQSTYFEAWLVRNVLIAQIGWNLQYHTMYYAYAYMPVTGMFYLQNEQKIGNYPFFDFFLNFQLDRGRIFVRTDGLNTVFKNALGKQNYLAYRYPTNDFRVKFGVSWTFYN